MLLESLRGPLRRKAPEQRQECTRCRILYHSVLDNCPNCGAKGPRGARRAPALLGPARTL
jgi:hypothetical protein